MSLSKYTSTTETTNLARVARLILGPCTDVLRDILRKELSPFNLSRAVKIWVDHKRDKNAKNPLSKQQTYLIFPPPTKQYGGDYSDFDVTILYLLLRNVCNITEHTAGWGKQPNSGDRSVSANIERIRLIRNKYYGHTSDFFLAESDFRQEWRNIHDIIVELESYLGSSTTYQDAVNEIKTCYMDPELKRCYIDILRLQKAIEINSDDVKTLQCVIPQNVKAQHEEEYIRRWKEEDSVFIETHAFSKMLKRVRQQPYVTFVGVPGSGKSATVQHIALKLQKEGYEVVPVLDFRDLRQYCDPHNPQVFVINDVIGVLGVQKVKLESFLEYGPKITSFKKSKVLVTCRGTLFNQCNKSFFTKEQNVIKLHSSENALSDDDQRNILEKHGLDRDLLSPALLTEASRMFPLLCKLYSNEKKFRSNGERFFINPIQCIIEEFDKMQQANSLFYATLVLCTLNNSIMSEDTLKDKQNKCFQEMKQEVLESCEVESNTDTFKFVKALSAMEGTYTKRRGKEFTFVHDSMFEITAYHFGRQFPELVLKYVKSSHVANYVKLQTCETQKEKNIETKDKSPIDTCTDERKECLGSTGANYDENSELRKGIDLCLRVYENQYPMLAQRLYRDIENMELYDVFMNDALKDNQLCKAFIGVLETKAYAELKSLFLNKQDNVSNVLRWDVTSSEESKNDKIANIGIKNFLYIEGLLLDKRQIIIEPFTCNVRVISWVIYYGHHQILRYIVDRTELHKETSSALFRDFNSHLRDLTPEQGTTASYMTYVLEETRLLVLSSYGGDVETVRILLEHIDLNFTINRTPHIYSHKVRFSGGDLCRRNTPLIAACLFGHVSVEKELIGVGADINMQSHDHTPLTAACNGGHLSVVKELRKKGADVIWRWTYNCSEGAATGRSKGKPKSLNDTPLNAACSGGHLQVVKELLKAGADVNLPELLKAKADVNHQDNEGSTPLLASIIRNQDKALIKDLLEAGAVVNQHDEEWFTPLAAACLVGDLSLVRELLEMGAFVNPQHVWFDDVKRSLQLILNVPFHCSLHNPDTILSLIEKGPEEKHITPLTAACLGGNLIVVKEVLQKGADVNPIFVWKTPLTIACKCRRLDVVKLLLKFGTNVNFNPWNTWTPDKYKTPLTVACKSGYLELVKELLNAKADVNPQSVCNTPLVHVSHLEQMVFAATKSLAACADGYIDVVRELLQRGADVNLKGRYSTPLTAACKGGHLNVVKELLQAEVNVNLHREDDMPLIVSCEGGNKVIFKELIEAGADVHLQGKYSTPLTAACSGEYTDIVRQLLNMGAKINQSTLWDTPLIAACRGGNANTVKEVLEAGAYVNLQNQEGETPLYKTVDSNKTSISVLKMLIKRGADYIQHAVVATNSKDDVVFKKNKVWDLKDNVYIKLRRADCDVLRHLLFIGLDSNQDILIRKGSNEADVKPLLFRLIDGSLFCNTKCPEKMVSVLLEAGADANLRVKYREYNCVVDKEGISALKRTRQMILELKNPQRYFSFKDKRMMKRKYRMILKEIKKHVRRYSI
ncbi:uncharacterized protein LOC133198405 [Saccostrea echinata]|uniref:uncharacterized protein LOC133198405 n=1 Tax=Saccostrea echinata TaxID=191078 RepID=UPI002A8252D5|nr:uncharacterized protein LOC133198405 [Saccostrea echinata]